MTSGKIRVGIAGAGAMGSGIAQVASTAGHEIYLYDTNPAGLDKARTGIMSSLQKLYEKNKIEEKPDDIISRIRFGQDLHGFEQCGLFIEAVIENLEVKQKLFASVERHLPSGAILATNTSSLPVIAIGANCEAKENVIGIHFFNPPVLMPLVEVIPSFVTAPALTETVKDLITSWGKLPVVAKDTPGFIVNRVARPFYGEAIKIYEEGIADFATIDWALKSQGGFKMGPFELMDFIGNDVNYSVTETVWTQMFYDPRYKPSLTQKRLFEAGLFGRKSGRGYYHYGPQSFNAEPKEDAIKADYIFRRVLAMLINEAADALFLKIATREDIDTAMTKGVNYPKGLLKWADEWGVKNVLQQLDLLYEEYRDDRYRASVLLRKMSKEAAAFY